MSSIEILVYRFDKLLFLFYDVNLQSREGCVVKVVHFNITWGYTLSQCSFTSSQFPLQHTKILLTTHKLITNGLKYVNRFVKCRFKSQSWNPGCYCNSYCTAATTTAAAAFYVCSQNCEMWLSFVVSVHMKPRSSHWMGFDETWYVSIFWKCVEKTRLTKFWQYWQVLYMKMLSHFWLCLTEFFIEREMF